MTQRATSHSVDVVHTCDTKTSLPQAVRQYTHAYLGICGNPIHSEPCSQSHNITQNTDSSVSDARGKFRFNKVASFFCEVSCQLIPCHTRGQTRFQVQAKLYKLTGTDCGNGNASMQHNHRRTTPGFMSWGNPQG